MEEMVYDESGNPRTATFADYPVISAAEHTVGLLVALARFRRRAHVEMLVGR